MKFNLTEKNIGISDLIVLEQKIGHSLTSEYKEHMLNYNGGTPQKNYYKGVYIAFFNPIKYGDETLEEIYDDLKEFLPKGYLPFAYDPGDNQICIDLNQGESYGKIYYVPMDMGGIVPEYLSGSLTELLEGLTENNDF